MEQGSTKDNCDEDEGIDDNHGILDVRLDYANVDCTNRVLNFAPRQEECCNNKTTTTSSSGTSKRRPSLLNGSAGGRVFPEVSSPTEQRYCNRNPMQFDCLIDDPPVAEPEVFLPIKKRRLKDLLSQREGGVVGVASAAGGGEEGRHHHQQGGVIMNYSSSSSRSSSYAAAAVVAPAAPYNDCDNSEEWWYYANQEWSRAKTHAARSSRCVPNKGGGGGTASGSDRGCGIGGGVGGGSSANSSSNSSYCDSAKEPLPPPSSREDCSTKTSIYDKSDPRSDEFRRWVRAFYPNGFDPQLTNPLLVKMHLVDPTRVGNKYPPWVTEEGLKKWDISRIAEDARKPFLYSRPDSSKVEVIPKSQLSKNWHSSQSTATPTKTFKTPAAGFSQTSAGCGDIHKTKDSSRLSFCKPGSVISYAGHSKPYEIDF
jgi:hypothetical protein